MQGQLATAYAQDMHVCAAGPGGCITQGDGKMLLGAFSLLCSAQFVDLQRADTTEKGCLPFAHLDHNTVPYYVLLIMLGTEKQTARSSHTICITQDSKQHTTVPHVSLHWQGHLHTCTCYTCVSHCDCSSGCTVALSQGSLQLPTHGVTPNCSAVLPAG